MRSAIAPLIFGATIFCACSAGPPNGREVAIVGDSPAELSRGIATARQAGRIPLFESVGCKTQHGEATLIFSPYAQIVRTRNALAVRAFDSIFVFAASNADVRFAQEPIQLSDLPAVQAPEIDRIVSTRPLCPPNVISAAENSALTDRWNGAKDPWQTGTPPVPWTSGAQLDALTRPYGNPH